MASNVREFNLGISEWIEVTVPDRADKLMRALLLDALLMLVLLTPVDTGRARGGWEVELSTSTVTADRGTLDPTGTLALARGFREIQSASGFDINYLTNAVAYIVELDDGHSQQAPAGMMAATKARLQAFLIVNRARL